MIFDMSDLNIDRRTELWPGHLRLLRPVRVYSNESVIIYFTKFSLQVTAQGGFSETVLHALFALILIPAGLNALGFRPPHAHAGIWMAPFCHSFPLCCV